MIRSKFFKLRDEPAFNHFIYVMERNYPFFENSFRQTVRPSYNGQSYNCHYGQYQHLDGWPRHVEGNFDIEYNCLPWRGVLT